jgi:hypothetical protein
MSKVSAVLDHLHHPRLVIWALATCSLVAGVLTYFYDSLTLVWPTAWSVFGVTAALVAYLCALHPTRFLVAASGALLVFTFTARGLALYNATSSVDPNGPTTATTASYIIGGTQWIVLAYLTFVVWRRLIVPWSIILTAER